MGFREIACILLGGLTGLLIALPWSFSSQDWPAFLAPILGGLLGLAVGYRQRGNVFFFYLCLISIIALATLLSSQLLGA